MQLPVYRWLQAATVLVAHKVQRLGGGEDNECSTYEELQKKQCSNSDMQCARAVLCSCICIGAVLYYIL